MGGRRTSSGETIGSAGRERNTVGYAGAQGHPSKRSKYLPPMNTSEYAGLAWYHKWHLDPEAAIAEWDALAEGLRAEQRMAEHAAILLWLAPLKQERGGASPETRAKALHNWAFELYESSKGNRGHNLRQSIECCDLALSDAAAGTEQWAKIQNSKGRALLFLPDSDRAQRLRDAIHCFDQALLSFSKGALGWIIAQYNRGSAFYYLSELPHADRYGNLSQAVRDYNKAIRASPRGSEVWATIHCNRAGALAELSECPAVKYAWRALRSCEGALAVLAPGTQVWASTQHNKGNALRALPDSVHHQNSTAAVGCYDLALSFRTLELFPEEWALTNYAKADVLREMKNLDDALKCAQNAVTGYKEVYRHDLIQRAEQLRDQIQAEIQCLK